jgi:hypothetical protein
LDNIGVMTMKMISSTSITSTMGVTLMSETTGGAVFFFILFSCGLWDLRGWKQPLLPAGRAASAADST